MTDQQFETYQQRMIGWDFDAKNDTNDPVYSFTTRLTEHELFLSRIVTDIWSILQEGKYDYLTLHTDRPMAFVRLFNFKLRSVHNKLYALHRRERYPNKTQDWAFHYWLLLLYDHLNYLEVIDNKIIFRNTAESGSAKPTPTVDNPGSKEGPAQYLSDFYSKHAGEMEYPKNVKEWVSTERNEAEHNKA